MARPHARPSAILDDVAYFRCLAWRVVVAGPVCEDIFNGRVTLSIHALVGWKVKAGRAAHGHATHCR